MTQEQFDLLLAFGATEAVRLIAEGDPRPAEQITLDTIRDNTTLERAAVLQRTVSEDRLTKLTTTRDSRDTTRAALDQEITDLEDELSR